MSARRLVGLVYAQRGWTPLQLMYLKKRSGVDKTGFITNRIHLKEQLHYLQNAQNIHPGQLLFLAVPSQYHLLQAAREHGCHGVLVTWQLMAGYNKDECQRLHVNEANGSTLWDIPDVAWVRIVWAQLQFQLQRRSRTFKPCEEMSPQV